MFRPNSLFWSDGYKVGHKRMLAAGTDFLYGTWIPRSLKHVDKSIKKIVSFGQQLAVRWLNDEFTENFFKIPLEEAMQFGKDMSMYLGLPYDASHFEALHKLGYLPVKIKSLPEGIETDPNVPHMTFINTVKGYAWLTLYLETIISSLSWKSSTSATLALKYKRSAYEWIMKTDPDNIGLLPFMCHDFSARGLDPFSMIASGLGHATSHRGSDTLVVIPAARYFYGEPKNEVVINSVNASEHSVSTTKIFTVGEKQMIIDWLIEFPTGILSIVADTFDLWKLLLEYISDPEVKKLIMAREGKLVIRPDSGDPVDIICGKKPKKRKYFAKYTEKELEDYEIDVDRILTEDGYINQLDDFLPSMSGGRDYTPDFKDGATCNILLGNRAISFEVYTGECYEATWCHTINATDVSNIKELDPVEKGSPEEQGVIQILWDIFGGTINEQGFKVLDPHIGAIYGDSINLERQVQIYTRLAERGFASTNIVLGIGSYTYQFNTRDTLGFAAKGAWFEANGIGYNIYKDPITDDGTKKSLKGRIAVYERITKEGITYNVKQECTEEEENQGILQVIFEDGKFFNQTTLTEIRNKLTA